MDFDFSNQNISVQTGDILSIVLHSETGLSQSYGLVGNGGAYGGGADFLRVDYFANANVWYEMAPELEVDLFFKTYVEPPPVPLPSTLLLLGSGLLGLVGWRRFRKIEIP